MKLFRMGALAVLAALLMGPGASAWAQGVPFGGPINQPAVSPYLNINRLGAPAGINYYNIVQPQLQFQASITQLQQQTSQLQSAATAVGPGATLSTGHPVYFGNLSHFYAPRGLAGIGGAGAGGLRGAAGGGFRPPGGGGAGLGQSSAGGLGRPPNVPGLGR